MNNRTIPSFITGFHVHPYHSVNYLHMHIICNNKNMIATDAFNEQTNSDKFVHTVTVLKSLNKNYNNTKNNTKPKPSIKILNNVLTESKNIFNKNSRLKDKVLYVDNQCFVINNRDRAAIGKNYNKKGREWGSTSKVHILVCPLKKIYNCLTLTEKDIKLVEHMKTVGEEIAKRYANESLFKKQSQIEFEIPNEVQGMDLNILFNQKREFNLSMDVFSKTLAALNLKGNKTLLNGKKENLHFFSGKFNKILSTLKRRQSKIMESNGMSNKIFSVKNPMNK